MSRRDLLLAVVATFAVFGPLATSARAAQLDPQWPVIGTHLTPDPGHPPMDDAVSTSDQAGGSIFVWSDASNIYANRVLATGALAWGNSGLPIFSGPGSQYSPVVVSDGSEGTFVATYTEGSYGVLIQHVLADGSADPTWPAQGRLLGSGEQTGVGDFKFNLFPDGAGGAVAMYMSYAHIWPARAQRVRANGTLAWGPEGIALTSSGNQGPPGQCVPDGAGGFILIYNGTYGTATRAKHVLSNGTLDPSWGTNGRVISSATWPEMRAVSDGAGGAIIVLRDTRAGNADLFAHHLQGSGLFDPAWPPGGAVLCDLPAGLSSDFSVVSDGSGGAYVAWTDERDSPLRVFTHRVTPSGPDPAWPEDGLAVSPLSAYGPRLASDGAGGAIVAWAQWEPVAIRAIGLGPEGIQPNWPQDGLLVNDDQHISEVRGLDSDGAGGAVVTWMNIYGWCGTGCARALFAHHLIVNGGPTHVSGPGSVAGGRLFPAAPNPTSGSTMLRFQLDAEGTISLDVHDHQGRLVRQVAAGTRQAGEHRERWDGRDEHGRAMPPGLYLVRLVLPDSRSVVSRVALVR